MLAQVLLAVLIRVFCPDGSSQDAVLCTSTTTSTRPVTTVTNVPTTTITATTTTTTLAGVALAPPFLGLVHENVCDTALVQPGFEQGWWSQECAGACAIGGAPYSCNQYEMPLVFTPPAWNAPPASITSTMQQFFHLNPKLPIWQFGWEENINSRCCSAAQLTTIDQQLSAVRQARTMAGNTAGIAYQLVWSTGNPYNGTSADLTTGTAASVQAFLAPSSPAPRNLEYIALHPYLWSNWPNPDIWVPAMMNQLKGWIATSQNPRLGVIFTEGGATVCDSPATGCTCTENGTTVRAMGQSEHADYWVKSHVLALANGVQKVVWYSGATDGTCSSGSSCEATCFGITNGAGRPTHTAYATMAHCLGAATSVQKMALATPFQAYDFAGPGGHCIVAWTYQPGTTQVVQPTLPQTPVAVTTLSGGRTPTSVTDKFGAALPLTSMTLSPSPVFIKTN